ncbi:MAG: DNA ligase [Candidatus Magasanikbacteria bacterium]|jgi:bifunctional non-homologous end joining protein LigD|nr:DNA ligase [Candidatus Magasanikbacteria bacterium]
MKSHRLLFVVHKHDATQLHFDFRLQIGTVMPSWAIPKGPTMDPTMKRLAMPTSDHSMEYRNFEGVITEGKYGAGPVMIWDEGYYIPQIEEKKGELTNIEDFDHAQKVMQAGLDAGQLKFELFGKKLKGSFALVKTKGFGPKDSWLMIKHRDDHVIEGFDAKTDDVSVVSSKTMDQIREENNIYTS